MLIAFKNTEITKPKIMAQLRAHAKADEIIKGQYWKDGKGCAVGCTIHSGNHAEYESRFGIPQMLARLEDCIFEGLPNDEAKKWPIRFISAVEPASNLSRVGWQFLHWLLTDEKVNPGINHPLVCDAIRRCADVLTPLSTGTRVDQSAVWSAAGSAESAAWSAAESARSAAWSAAESARSARSAVWSAARSAESAAESARSAVWSAARSAESAAGSARSAGSAAKSARSAQSAESAESAVWSAESAAGSARSAGSAAKSARSAGSAESAAYILMADKLIALIKLAMLIRLTPTGLRTSPGTARNTHVG